MLKSLPTPLTTKQLMDLLTSFPNTAKIRQTETTTVVFAPNGDKIFSALKAPNRNQWVARAVEGLVVAK